MHCLRPKGWEVSIEPQLGAGGGYLNICLISRTEGRAVLIELKSSDKPGHIEKDANEALEQIVNKNTIKTKKVICILREYGIASYHLASFVRGQYLELDAHRRWVEKDDPAM